MCCKSKNNHVLLSNIKIKCSNLVLYLDLKHFSKANIHLKLCYEVNLLCSILIAKAYTLNNHIQF